MKIDAALQWLDVERIETTRIVKLGEGARMLGLCWHWTGSGVAVDDRDGRALCRRIRKLPPPHFASTREREAASAAGIEPSPSSWHLLLDRSGPVIQCAPFNVGTWHVGKPGMVAGALRSVNNVLIGCELENLGEVRRMADGRWTNGTYIAPADRRVTEVSGRFFDAFTDEQVLAATEVVRVLSKAFKFSRAACSYGHTDFDSPRKIDPGPLWRGVVLPRILNEVGLS